MTYIIVPAKERKGAATQSMLIVDEQENTVKAFPFQTGNTNDMIAAMFEADDYVDNVLRKGAQS